MTSQPVLDPRIVDSLRRLGTTPGALDELVVLYVDTGELALRELEAAVLAGDTEAAAAAAHRLKGSSANLGAARVAAACAQVEERIATGAEAAPAVAALRSAYDEACTALRAEFGDR